jgi:uncharacterized membrane protein YeaQ/YmgE (transglycosylase-associated protein family)
MISLGSMLAFLAFGLVVGAVARLLMPGREPGGWLFSLLLGVAGSFLGGFIGRGVGLYGPGDRAGFVMSVLGAMILVGAYHTLRRRVSPQ